MQGSKCQPLIGGSLLFDGNVLYHRMTKYSETVELVNYYPTILLWYYCPK
jgi:hypothetical protein